MAIRIIPFAEADPDAVRGLIAQTWEVDPDEAFVREVFAWRYFARPRGDTLVALDGSTCIGVIDSLLRPYRLDGRSIFVRETCDWFTLPHYRPLGIGTALMRRFMGCPEPILSIGGREATLALLKRLNWQPIGQVGEYILPVTLRMLAAKALARLRLGEAIVQMIPARLRLRVQVLDPPQLLHVAPLIDANNAPQPSGAYALAQLLEEADRAWLAAAPGHVGELVGLKFAVDGHPAAISISRVEPYIFGRIGRILHVQIAGPRAAVSDWVVTATTRSLLMRGAELITCRTSCPTIGQALSQAGFWRARAQPVFWWPGADLPPAGPIHVTYLRADDALSIGSLAKAQTSCAPERLPSPSDSPVPSTRR